MVDNASFQAQVEHHIRIDIPYWWEGGTNFTSQLFTLIAKADPANLYRLKQVYPTEVEAFRVWDAARWQQVKDRDDT